MLDIVEKLEEEYDDHYWQACGLQGACNSIAEWHFGYAEGVRYALELIKKEDD